MVSTFFEFFHKENISLNYFFLILFNKITVLLYLSNCCTYTSLASFQNFFIKCLIADFVLLWRVLFSTGTAAQGDPTSPVL